MSDSEKIWSFYAYVELVSSKLWSGLLLPLSVVTYRITHAQYFALIDFYLSPSRACTRSSLDGGNHSEAIFSLLLTLLGCKWLMDPITGAARHVSGINDGLGPRRGCN